MRTARYILGRILKAFLIVLAVAIMNFFLIRIAPGDPATVIAGQSGDADAIYLQQLRSDFGLDEPMPVQLGIYLKKLAVLDFGMSYRERRPVSQIIWERLPPTLEITASAFVLALFAGVLLGTVAAVNRGGVWDRAATAFSLVFYATPLFWVGLLLVLVFSVELDWLPAFGRTTIAGPDSGLPTLLDRLKHLVLPVLTLTLFYLALYARMTRASMVETLDMDFIKTARAKGIGRARILFVHALRNAVLPILTLAGVQVGQLLSGTIIVETIFGWPGLGLLAFNAVLQRDYNTLLAVFFVTSILVVLANLVVDGLYVLIDPRTAART
ncbi:MAG: ABC transporter permease [Rhizobiales bacterium 65-79]|jgi:peptide/nickel transport system permease protein|nr:ABC transporter permease [Hyphomicrobiales bacterium]OJU03916.1 MAG: ABC transporter permease [Rhizobiales bacterium 65-79]